MHGRPLAQWIDLSTGINPHWYPVPENAPNAWHRLPEADPALVDSACAYYGAPAMLPVAGTQAAIQALPRLRAPGRVVVAAPSYAEHAHHWGQHGHQLRQVPYPELDNAVDHCEVLVVCNPNNPTGARIAPEILLAWAEKLAIRGGWLVVDEAFGDTEDAASLGIHTGQAGLIVLRSVGKFFGLAGLRLGFVAAHPALLAKLAAMLGPWTVSGPAQQVALAALRDTPWQQAMRARLQTEGARLRQLLASHGMDSSGCALFQWWPAARAEDFHRHMAARGIWVRLFRHAARGIRLGLPPDEPAWRQLEQALIAWNKENT
ncbi:cobalamin biosynthetic protein CobC [Janthinobacterium psychrotolerans]|uniref:threonine-phosphate decarboxylase n=2 Tax=Janthinobacterium psychrotolerans TaxID=1747903 RepID=A0A1A7C0A8_9BURK|nr:cobalamin biosynthetic protein CobC [Janthinobacterium psychrotolerans]